MFCRSQNINVNNMCSPELTAIGKHSLIFFDILFFTPSSPKISTQNLSSFAHNLQISLMLADSISHKNHFSCFMSITAQLFHTVPYYVKNISPLQFTMAVTTVTADAGSHVHHFQNNLPANYATQRLLCTSEYSDLKKEIMHNLT